MLQWRRVGGLSLVRSRKSILITLVQKWSHKQLELSRMLSGCTLLLFQVGDTWWSLCVTVFFGILGYVPSANCVNGFSWTERRVFVRTNFQATSDSMDPWDWSSLCLLDVDSILLETAASLFLRFYPPNETLEDRRLSRKTQWRKKETRVLRTATVTNIQNNQIPVKHNSTSQLLYLSIFAMGTPKIGHLKESVKSRNWPLSVSRLIPQGSRSQTNTSKVYKKGNFFYL